MAALTKLKEVEWTWSWTAHENKRPDWLAFKNYMQLTYGLEQQEYVCLGPGPLLSRSFLQKFAEAEDVEWVHEEITLPAYAEVFDYRLADHGMHPGFSLTDEDKYFSCRDTTRVSISDIKVQTRNSNGRRTFHPVKQMITFDEIIAMIK